jgi:hypothetical protein
MCIMRAQACVSRSSTAVRIETDDPKRVVIRLRWNDARSARVAAEDLGRLHIRTDPGGVCGSLPRGFLHGYAWCDRFDARMLGHLCAEESRPHELLVCILPADNPEALVERLRTQARG